MSGGRGAAPADARPPAAPPGLLPAVGLLSAATLAFEISLMRVLLVASWHHFAFLVISLALLGYGASGTMLVVLRRRLLPRAPAALFALALGAAAAMPLCAALSQHVPIEARFLPALAARQAAWWILFWALLAFPFLLAAAALGLALMVAPTRAGTVYGANLIGSAAGALAAPAAMTVVPPAWLPLLTGALGLLGAAALRPAAGPRGPRRAAALAAAVALVAGWTWLDPPRVRVDPYKAAAGLRRLEAQGSVHLAARTYGPRALLEAYRGPVLHDLPFLAVGGAAAPPPVTVLLADGHRAGSVLEVGSARDARVVDDTLMALPHALVRPARAALLGETGGVNAWLAIRHGAGHVEFVQGDGKVIELLRGPLAGHGGRVLEHAAVRARIAEPRQFIEQDRGAWDLIQLSSMEAWTAGAGGMGGLAENHLVTVAGLAACLERLTPDGVLTVTRGIQTPPRDNVKLLATAAAALRRIGVDAPAAHVAVVRDYLAVCTIVRPRPWTAAEVEALRRACDRRQLTPVWFEGVRADELNRPDALPAAPDGVGDRYHYAARKLLSPEAGAFIESWRFDIRPPTDNRPFFADFCRLDAIGAMRRAYGDLWLTRVEIAYLFVLAALVVIAVVGAAATLLPLPWLPSGRAVRGRGATAAYFGCLGLAYLLLEMVYLSRLTFLIGDPVLAAAVTVGGFLLFSGAGSLTSQRLKRRREAVLAALVALLAVAGLGGLWALGEGATLAAPLPARVLLGLLVVAPLAWLMGFPMPMGLARLGGRGTGAPGEALIPWAWGINGFASVLAPPLAVAAAMTWGYHVVALTAVGLYLLAGGLFRRLPASDTGGLIGTGAPG